MGTHVQTQTRFKIKLCRDLLEVDIPPDEGIQPISTNLSFLLRGHSPIEEPKDQAQWDPQLGQLGLFQLTIHPETLQQLQLLLLLQLQPLHMQQLQLAMSMLQLTTLPDCKK